MLKKLVVCGVLVSAVACGSSDTQPSSRSYPNLVGQWTGTVTIVVTQGANVIVATNVCTANWTVNNETAGNFTGTVTFIRGTSVPCVESPTLTGSVTPDGAVTATLSSTLSSSVGSLQGCTLSLARPLTGQIGSQIVDRGLLHLFGMIDWTCGVNQIREGINIELGHGFL